MKELFGKKVDYKVLCSNKGIQVEKYPIIRDDNGFVPMYVVSPQHGRSYVVAKRENRHIVTKGNGLSYGTKIALQTAEHNVDVWGLLAKQDAIRDFTVGVEIANLGIKTNKMEYVLELEKEIPIRDGLFVRPVLLQYSVECPYRISDAPFMDMVMIHEYVKTWKKADRWNSKNYYSIVANVLFSNLRLLHDNGILHNAITPQNLTWALELLDFELASSPSYPYDDEDYRRHVPDLFEREILFTYQIILDIAGILREDVDYKLMDSIMYRYGFSL